MGRAGVPRHLILEKVSDQDYVSYVRENIFAPLGVPAGEVILGRTFPHDRDPREPWRTREVCPAPTRWPSSGATGSTTSSFSTAGPAAPAPGDRSSKPAEYDVVQVRRDFPESDNPTHRKRGCDPVCCSFLRFARVSSYFRDRGIRDSRAVL